MIKIDHLIGKPYKHGEQDCYTIVQQFFADNYGLKLADYARPDSWWNHGLKLYADHARDEGFDLIDVAPQDWQIGDCFGISINAPTVHHVAIYVGENKILHHFTDRLSECVQYKLIWRKHTVCTWRHRALVGQAKVPDTVSIVDILDPSVRREIGL